MLGELVKEIRGNKGLSQNYVLDSLMTQSAYSKFELGRTEIRASVFLNILNKLDMSLEEFKFLQNDYQFTIRDEIIHRFFYMSYNDETVLLEVNELAKEYLEKHQTQDYLIKEIYYLCQAFLTLLEKKDFTEASISANKVWERVSKRNMLYVMDLYLLNSILFIFPLETIFEIRKLVELSIEKYGNLFRLQRIRINMFINIAYLLMKEEQFEKAIDELEEAITICRTEKTYIQLAICYIRKGVCLNRLKQQGNVWIDKGNQLLLAIEEDDLVQKLSNEIRQFIE